MKIGFDPEKYLSEQSKYILERVNKFDKLYLEFGGKLVDDYHASRVLPGFDSDAKINLLHKLKDQAEIIICVYAGDIERNKIRADYGITYDLDVLRLIDDLRKRDLTVNSVVITRYEDQPASQLFIRKLSRRGIKTYTHSATKGYPTDVDTIVSDEGYGANPYIETTKPIVVVTAPGPGSGKLGTCLSQLYHEYKRGTKAGYAKFETFPVWNVPLKHPLNIAYEAATVDLKDVNMIDSFHLEAYGESAVNYNRDLEVFPVIKRIIERITGGESMYQSPTDMGVNRVGFGIIDDEAVQEASRQEILRRYFNVACEYKKGYVDSETKERSEMILSEMNMIPEDRSVVLPAREYKKEVKKRIPEGSTTVVAMQMDNGTMMTGRNSDLMTSSASVVLNATKYLAGIADEIHLISPEVLTPILKLKRQTLGEEEHILTCEEILTALSISALTNPTALMALNKLEDLRNLEAHSTTILNRGDEQVLRKLGVNVTSDPVFFSTSLYYNS